MEYTQLDELIKQASIKLHESVHDVESLNRWRTQMFTFINTIAKLKLPSSSPLSTNLNVSLDPVDWPLARCVAHEIIDSSLDFIQHVRDRRVWQPVSVDVRMTLECDPLPEHGQSLADVFRDVITYVLPYPSGNIHPRFLGWADGEGTLGGILADMIATTMNANCDGGSHSAIYIERTVIRWMCQLFNFPKASSGGLIVSGTSMATVISMAAARYRALINVRQDGLVGGPQLIAYASTETHLCIAKALELLGLGSRALRHVPVDENFCLKIDDLKTMIKTDRAKGLIPFCIVGNAGEFNREAVFFVYKCTFLGTVNTGAFDNLLHLSSIARSENIWLHVDGAFGSLVVLDPERRQLVSGIDQVDSLAFDFHKWLHCPYDSGCVLIRDINHLQSTFSVDQSYLAETDRGCSSDKPWFCEFGPELSRPFRALRVWSTLKEHGTIKLGKKISENCEQAQYLVSLLEKHDNIIRIIRPITLNIVNFRFEPNELEHVDAETLDVFNDELVADIQVSGIAVSIDDTHSRTSLHSCGYRQSPKYYRRL